MYTLCCVAPLQQLSTPLSAHLSTNVQIKAPTDPFADLQDDSVEVLREVLLVLLIRTATSDQFVPDIGTLEDVSGFYMSLGKHRSSFVVQEGQQVLHQLRGLPKLL